MRSELERLLTETAGVPQIGAHVMHMVALPEGLLSTLSPEDAALKTARVELNEMLANSMARPRQLLGLFQEFDELARIDLDAYLAEVSEQKCDLPAYAALMDKWSKMAVKVMDATPPEVHCRLLLVACGELKETRQ